MHLLTAWLRSYRLRKINSRALVSLALVAGALILPGIAPESAVAATGNSAIAALDTLPVKGKAPKTGYERSLFSDGWGDIGGCDVRNFILKRDLKSVTLRDSCRVNTGILNDPYTGKLIRFKYGVGTSSAVQIDHVVALSDAWQKGGAEI